MSAPEMGTTPPLAKDIPAGTWPGAVVYLRLRGGTLPGT